MITTTGTYAIRAVAYLARARARLGAGANVTAAEIARATHAPRNYLTKILHTLAHAGVLDSTRGRCGGFRLADDANQVTLRDVLAPFEDVRIHDCVLGPDGCPRGIGCPSHERCVAISEQMNHFLSTTRITDLNGYE